MTLNDPGAMRDVNVKVGDQLYAMACEQGQEARLTELGAILNGRFQNLKSDCPGIADKHLLVMVGILLCDDIDLLRKQLARRDDDDRLRSDELKAQAEARHEREQDDVAAIDVRRHHLKKIIERLENDSGF